MFPHKTKEAYSQTLVRFLTLARKALHPLGVRISADVFGLSASHNLGIGQNVKRIAPLLDAISPMAYPSHYYPGEFNIPNPDDAPGRIVSYTMRDFRKALRGTKTQLAPVAAGLQPAAPLHAGRRAGPDPGRREGRGQGLAAVERRRAVHERALATAAADLAAGAWRGSTVRWVGRWPPRIRSRSPRSRPSS